MTKCPGIDGLSGVVPVVTPADEREQVPEQSLAKFVPPFGYTRI